MMSVYSRLLTEKLNPRSKNLDLLSIPSILRLMNQEDVRILGAIRSQIDNLTRGVEMAEAILRAGGRIIFIGAGTSGRLGVLEAAECPPTYHTAPGLVQAIIAGGPRAVFGAREGAEDNDTDGRLAVSRVCRREDLIIGLSASGVTPFTLAGLHQARRMGCRTILVSCNRSAKKNLSLSLPSPSEIRGGVRVTQSPTLIITLNTGPEILAGSTRLKAGTAIKMAANMIITSVMIRLGKAHGNRMVDLEIKSLKLRERAITMIQQLAGVSRVMAETALREARGRVKPAILMASRCFSLRRAVFLLRKNDGFLRPALLSARREKGDGRRQK